MGHRQDDHALVGVDTTGDIFEFDGKHIDGDETSILTATAVVAVRHGLVHVGVSDEFASLWMHLFVVFGTLVALEMAKVVVECGGGRITAETSSWYVAVMAQQAVLVAEVDGRDGQAQKIRAAHDRKILGVSTRSRRGTPRRSRCRWRGKAV